MAERRCVHRRWIGACDVCKPIQTPKDQLWHFRRWGQDFTSKRQFEQAASQRGEVVVTKDDVLRNGAPYKPAPKRIPREVIRDVVQQVKPKLKELSHA